MKNALTRHLSALALQLLITLPAAGVAMHWQYGHLTRVAADLHYIPRAEFASAGLYVWFLTGLSFALVAIFLVKPLHAWLGVSKGTPAPAEDDEDAPKGGGGTLRSRPV